MNYLQAIITANKLRNGKLKIKHHSTFVTWNVAEDDDYLRYEQARNIIYRYRKIEKILKRLEII